VTVAGRPGTAAITAVIVLYESGAVIDECLETLTTAAPRRGVDAWAVDNASRDDGPARAARRLGEGRVLRLPENRGFGAGVNAVLERFETPYLALVNPDLVLPPGSLDVLADALDAEPRTGLAAPRIRTRGGGPEPSAGHFPTLEREWAHALFLDRLAGREGRRFAPGPGTRAVDWVSGACWLLRREAVLAVGPLDEDYFMYFEDVDYCRRLRTAGWDVRIVPEVEAVHGLARGSTRSGELAADGGAQPLFHYFAKFHAGDDPRRVLRPLRTGWRLRWLLHRLRALGGSPRSAAIAARYAAALAGGGPRSSRAAIDTPTGRR
jgi:GT2 family glycosyltransferase